jgi:hypothetical protein
MSLNFFDAACQEPPLNNTLFGLCDDQNGTKAYTNTDEPEKWIATVKNSNSSTLIFTAIDKCVIKDHEEKERGRCDGMLTSDNHLYLVELKELSARWQQDAIEQLESTIQFIKANHDISGYKHKKAFACNKRHGKFQVTGSELNIRFFKNYGFRIDIQAEIIIV